MSSLKPSYGQTGASSPPACPSQSPKQLLCPMSAQGGQSSPASHQPCLLPVNFTSFQLWFDHILQEPSPLSIPSNILITMTSIRSYLTTTCAIFSPDQWHHLTVRATNTDWTYLVTASFIFNSPILKTWMKFTLLITSLFVRYKQSYSYSLWHLRINVRGS